MNQTSANHGYATAGKVAAGVALVALPVVGVKMFLSAQASKQATNRATEKDLEYDLTALSQVDPALVKWQEAGHMETGLASAKAIAVTPSGEILVGADGVVRRLSSPAQWDRRAPARPESAGMTLATIPVSGQVTALATDPQGTIYVGIGNRLELFTPAGVTKGVLADLGPDAQITSIAVGGGSIYVADFGARAVHRLNMTGKPLNLIGKGDPARHIDPLLLPSPHLDVAVAADGTVWVSDPGRYRVEHYSPEGDLRSFWGVPGTAIDGFIGCCNPTDFWLMADGSFVTAEKGVVRVKRYTSDGKLDSVVATPASFGPNMYGADVTADAAGRVIVLARGSGVVRVFEEKP